MKKYNFSKYFDVEDIKYYEPRIIITILEDILGKDLSTIKSDIEELKIIVDKQQIVDFLDKTFEEEEPEVKARLENPKPSKPKEHNDGIWTPLTDEEIKEATQHFGDELTAARYGFDSFTLDYFHKYSNIVRNKAKKILDIIEKIVNKDASIIELLVELDIQLDENGNISKEDIIRLIPPFIHNYNSLVEKINTANNLETYLTFKLSKHSVYRNGCSEGELYPSTSIQVKNLYYDYLPGKISLSTNQKKELREKERKSMKVLVKDLLDW